MKQKVVLRYRDGAFVGKDYPSGGYPFRTDAWGAHDFRDDTEAMQYQKMFAKEISPVVILLDVVVVTEFQF